MICSEKILGFNYVSLRFLLAHIQYYAKQSRSLLLRSSIIGPLSQITFLLCLSYPQFSSKLQLLCLENPIRLLFNIPVRYLFMKTNF